MNFEIVFIIKLYLRSATYTVYDKSKTHDGIKVKGPPNLVV